MTEEDDKRLLEMAAQAAGIEHGSDRLECGLSLTDPDGRHRSLPRWNPLDDDGDALRLAMKLGIDLEWRSDARVAAYRHTNADGYCFTAFESSRENRAKNTRRAIVRAAAAIGEALRIEDLRNGDRVRLYPSAATCCSTTNELRQSND